MNSRQIYENLIKSRQVLNRTKKQNFYEKHHILPKSLGGKNTSNNLVLLTPKEHYIAHLLLTQMYTGKEKAKMCYALFAMCRVNKNQKRLISSRQYELAKKLVSENCAGENASFFGKKLSEKTKKDLSERMKGDNNPSIKFGVWNKGKKLSPLKKEHKEKIALGNLGKKYSDETKNKMSISAKGKKKTESHKLKLSQANIGKKFSKETKLKMSLARKNKSQKKVTCPHCNLSGGLSSMKRYHFNNCKNQR